MANIGTSSAGKVMTASGVTTNPSFQSIGSLSGLTANGVVLAQGTGAFQASSSGTLGQIFMSNGPGVNPSFQSGGTFFGQTITGNSGGALSPTAGNWNILGASSAAGTSPVSSSGSGSTLTMNVQKSQAIASTDATKVGLCNFDSAAFSVDANGFVTLKGGTEAIDSIGVDATSGGGTNPVLPTAAGLVTVNGATVAAGTNPIRTVSTAVNVYQVQAQISQAIASTDATKIGLCNFNSAQFTVDTNGFVTSLGAGFVWTDVSGAQAAAVNHGYFITGTCTSTLPASPSQGDTIKYIVDHASQLLTITGNTGQIIRLGNTSTAAAGTAISTLQGDAIELIYRSSDTTWLALSSIGQWNLT